MWALSSVRLDGASLLAVDPFGLAAEVLCAEPEASADTFELAARTETPPSMYARVV